MPGLAHSEFPDEEVRVSEPSSAEQVRRGVMALTRRMRSERPDGGAPLQSISVLGHLRREGPLTPGRLAQLERVQPQSLTRVLNELEGAGQLVREPNPEDGRSHRVRMTEDGLDVLRHDVRQRSAWLGLAMAELTPLERDVLVLAAGVMEKLALAEATALHR